MEEKEKKAFHIERTERLECANETALTILGRYPKPYNEAYFNTIVQSLAYYPVDVQKALTDLREGISGKLKSLPTPAHIFEYGDEAWKRIDDENLMSKPRVLVQKGTPAWNAWQDKRGSTPCMTFKSKDGTLIEGWNFPTEFPQTEPAKKGN